MMVRAQSTTSLTMRQSVRWYTAQIASASSGMAGSLRAAVTRHRGWLSPIVRNVAKIEPTASTTIMESRLLEGVAVDICTSTSMERLMLRTYTVRNAEGHYQMRVLAT